MGCYGRDSSMDTKVYFIRHAQSEKDFVQKNSLDMKYVEGFRERYVDGWVEDFIGYTKQQWEGFDYKLGNGESLNEVRHRNIASLQSLLDDFSGKRIAIGTHGTTLSLIIHHYEY